VALLCALTVLAQVHAAPTDVNAGQLVDRLKQLLRHRHAKVSAVLYAFVTKGHMVKQRLNDVRKGLQNKQKSDFNIYAGDVCCGQKGFPASFP